eukprot:g10157.t1
MVGSARRLLEMKDEAGVAYEVIRWSPSHPLTKINTNFGVPFVLATTLLLVLALCLRCLAYFKLAYFSMDMNIVYKPSRKVIDSLTLAAFTFQGLAHQLSKVSGFLGFEWNFSGLGLSLTLVVLFMLTWLVNLPFNKQHILLRVCIWFSRRQWQERVGDSSAFTKLAFLLIVVIAPIGQVLMVSFRCFGLKMPYQRLLEEICMGFNCIDIFAIIYFMGFLPIVDGFTVSLVEGKFATGPMLCFLVAVGVVREVCFLTGRGLVGRLRPRVSRAAGDLGTPPPNLPGLEPSQLSLGTAFALFAAGPNGAGGIVAYFTGNNYMMEDLAEKSNLLRSSWKLSSTESPQQGRIRFVGQLQGSLGQAAFLTACLAGAIFGVALLLVQIFPEGPFSVGPDWWFLPIILSPSAGVYYWQRAFRKDIVEIQLGMSDDFMETTLLLLGKLLRTRQDTIEELQSGVRFQSDTGKLYRLMEKGMEFQPGIFESNEGVKVYRERRPPREDGGETSAAKAAVGRRPID